MESQSEVGESTSTVSKNRNNNYWKVLGHSIHKHEFAYLSEIFILFIVIIACLVNLSLNAGPTEVWLSLLASSVGILAPNPRLKIPTSAEKDDGRLLSDSA